MTTYFTGPEAYRGGHLVFELTPTMSTDAQLVKSGGGRVCRLHNPYADTIKVTVYDAAANDATTLASALVIWSGNLPTTQPLDLDFPVQNGIVVQAGTAPTHTLPITYV